MKTNNWLIPEIAPKDGTMILAQFKYSPFTLPAVWSEPSQEWCVAMPQVQPVNGKWTDWYFENEYFAPADLVQWHAIPEIPK